MTPKCIFIVIFANNWSYKMILDIYEAKKEKKEEIYNFRDILFKYEYKCKYIGPIIKFMSYIILILLEKLLFIKF